MRKKIRNVLIGILLLGVLGVLSVVGMDWYVMKTGEKHITTMDAARQADAAIVLGALVWGDEVSPTLAQRLEMGYEVYAAGKAKKIIVSGDHGRIEYNEVNAMRKYLMEKGVPKEDIFMDHAGFNTYDTLYRARDVFDVKTAIVVTQREHLLRALYIADRLKMNVQGIEAGQYDSNEIKYQRPREYLARVKAVLQCEVLHSKPKYLGEVIPISGSGIATED